MPAWTIFLLLGAAVAADDFEPNYDESRVPRFTLPDPLIDAKGRPVRTAEEWKSHRRGEILELFREHVYGRRPPRPKVHAKALETDPAALGGRATRKQIELTLGDAPDAPRIEVLIYAPNPKKPAPAFLGLNFQGNQVVHVDPAIRVTQRWVRENDDHRAREDSRGAQAANWSVEKLIDRGYAVVTAYYGDLEPDHPEGWREGVRAYFPVDDAAPRDANGRVTGFRPGDWGAIGAWAWGLSCILDALESEPLIDASRVAVVGHSRLGKTALWAGAEDERFAIVISNNSGEGGAALARRRFGETTARINTVFPHWFCGRHKEYNDRESMRPTDQHELLALIAPRPVYVASATEDRWADPKGEFLAAVSAEPVYKLFGKEGLGRTKMPPADTPIGDAIGYHLRTGGHALEPYDWDRYLDFADRHW